MVQVNRLEGTPLACIATAEELVELKPHDLN